MSTIPSYEELVAALASATEAHHEYERRFLGGVLDEQWPGWYAAYVLGRVGDFASPTDLASWLASAPSDEEWSAAAASFVLNRLNLPE